MNSSNNNTRNIPVAPLPNPGEGGPVNPGGMTNMPVAPLPNPGEGGPVFPGIMENVPVAPLPNPGEGGPIYPGGAGNIPVVPLPNPGEGGPIFPGGMESTPVIPLPNPGEGGPVYPGKPGLTIPIFPIPNPPCYFCSSGTYGQVRFLNAANGYQPFRVYINNRFIVNGLEFASLTAYGRVSNGFQTITVAGLDGYIYLQKSMPFKSNEKTTIAIINTSTGLDLLQISDTPCNKPRNLSCFRVCNLAYYSNPLDVILYDGRVVYSDVRYKEVTVFKRIQPGSYEFYIAETNMIPTPRMEDIETMDSSRMLMNIPDALVSFFIDVNPNAMYTVFILNWNDSPDAIQTMIVEDRL